MSDAVMDTTLAPAEPVIVPVIKVAPAPEAAAPAPAPGLSAPAEVPKEVPSPASDPRPAETPVVPVPPAVTPQPTETPVIPKPQEVPMPAQEAASSPRSEQGSGTGAPAPTVSIPTQVGIKDRLSAALEKIRFNKRRKLDKILLLAAQKGSIKNDDVEKLVKVSDATATRYLSQLVTEGRLKRVGAQKQPTYEPM